MSNLTKIFSNSPTMSAATSSSTSSSSVSYKKKLKPLKMKKYLSNSINNLVSGVKKGLKFSKNNDNEINNNSSYSNYCIVDDFDTKSATNINYNEIFDQSENNADDEFIFMRSDENFKLSNNDGICSESNKKQDEFSSYILSSAEEELLKAQSTVVKDKIDDKTNGDNIDNKNNATKNARKIQKEKTFDSANSEILNENESNKVEVETKKEIENEDEIVTDESPFKSICSNNTDINEVLNSTVTNPTNDNLIDSKASDDTTNQTQNESTKDETNKSSAPKIEPLYYELQINLREGKNLAIRDVGGSSDPYAKFLINNECLYKSKTIFRNLNPIWNEEFTIKLPKRANFLSDKLFPNCNFNRQSFQSSEASFEKSKLTILVYDYDRGFFTDDFIGYADINYTSLKENVLTTMELELKDDKLSPLEKLGVVKLDLLLIPKYAEDKVSFHKNQTDTIHRSKRANQYWHGVVNVLLIQGNNLLAMDDNGYSDPYIKFKLGNEKYRSKTIKRSLNPLYLEQFQLYIYDNEKMSLCVSVYDYDFNKGADDFMGRASLNLKQFEIEKTHDVKLELEDGAGIIHMLVTITGTIGSNLNTDADYNKEVQHDNDFYKDNIIREYGLVNSFKNVDDIGWLQVKLIKAEGLASADMNGKSDPFCTLQLINQYVQSHTEYKTLNPEWGKLFEFRINDIHAILEISVFDEDKNKVYEFLGKVAIPLLTIQNGKRKCYALKDRKLIRRTKGLIELELNLIYNPIKAVIRTFNPREEKFLQPEPKLKIPTLKQNIARVHNVVEGVINTITFVDSAFNWENPFRSIVLFIAFILIVLNFEIYMLPLTLLLVFLKNYVLLRLKSPSYIYEDEDNMYFEYNEDEEDVETDNSRSEPKKSFRERLNEIQDICLKIQESLDFIASLCERIINVFNFSVPWLSYLAIIVLVIASLILSFIPLRYLILAYGINKFTKKFRKPRNYVDNTEILDFLSRLPSKKELFQYREFKVLPDQQNQSFNSLQKTGTSESKSGKRKRN